jgi:hypothetical protein
LVSVSLLDGSHKRHELAGNNPVEVSILHSLVLLVLLDIESLEVVPLELDGVFQTLQTLQEGALVETIAL